MKRKKCHRCKKKIDTKKEKWVQILTMEAEDIKAEENFHWKCWGELHRDKAKELIGKAKEKAKDMMADTIQNMKDMINDAKRTGEEAGGQTIEV